MLLLPRLKSLEHNCLQTVCAAKAQLLRFDAGSWNVLLSEIETSPDGHEFPDRDLGPS